MPYRSSWLPRALPALLLAALALQSLLLTGCGLSLNGESASTDVTATATEDVVKSCGFDIRMFSPHVPQRGVLVIYERGDSEQLFDDADVQEMAKRDGLAMVFAHQCNALDFADLQPDGSRGPGRELFTALQQLSVKTNHPELATANVILYGFSAAGVLVATTTNLYPGRVLGAILYAAGAYYYDITAIAIPPAATRVPTLVISNAQDGASGTTRDHGYFQRARKTGGLWAYAVQTGFEHCCTESTKALIVPWIDAVVALRAVPVSPASNTQAHAPLQVNAASGVLGSFTCAPNAKVDYYRNVNCSFQDVAVGRTGGAGAETAWLPSQASAKAWLTWVTRHHGG